MKFVDCFPKRTTVLATDILEEDRFNTKNEELVKRRFYEQMCVIHTIQIPYVLVLYYRFSPKDRMANVGVHMVSGNTCRCYLRDKW